MSGCRSAVERDLAVDEKLLKRVRRFESCRGNSHMPRPIMVRGMWHPGVTSTAAVTDDRGASSADGRCVHGPALGVLRDVRVDVLGDAAHGARS